MIYLPPSGAVLWFALTLHGLNIKVSIVQVIKPLVIALGWAWQCWPISQLAIPHVGPCPTCGTTP